jgi:hypothetical protein
MADLEPLADDLWSLLDAEKRHEEAPVAARDRVLLRLGGTLGLGAPVAHGGRTDPRPPRATPLVHAGAVARLARAAVIFTAGAASGVGGVQAVQHLRARPTPAARVPAGRPAAPVASEAPQMVPIPPPPRATEPPVARPRRAPAPTPPPVAAPAEPAVEPPVEDDGRLGAERGLLEIARAALVRGEAAGALAALARHEQTFPHGELTEEREGLFVQALVAARRYDDARARAARFSRRYPRSLFAPVVAQALESIP